MTQTNPEQWAVELWEAASDEASDSSVKWRRHASEAAALTIQAAFAEREARLVEAAKAILHAVCHETGFAAAVRADSGLAYPWEPLDIAEAQLRQALAPFTKGQP